MSTRRVIQFSSSSSTKAANSTDPLEHLRNNWLPINAIFLRSIAQRLNAGEFDASPLSLVNELKADIGLFTYCLRKAGELGWCKDEAKDPFEYLNRLTLPQFKQLLSVREGEISVHSLSDMSKLQALRLKHTLVSSTTAEALGGRLGLDKQLIFSSALFRQVGLNLVAWNYPRVYSKALESCINGENDLERQLLKQLGFSPRSLGVQLLAPDQALGEAFMIAVGERVGTNQEGLLASKLCEIGERFARASDPEFFPHDTRGQEAVVQEIQHFLGPNGLALLQEQVGLRAMNYSSGMNKPFDIETNPEKNLETADLQVANRLISGNPHVQKLPEWLKEKFRKVYTKLSPGKVSPDALQILVSDVIPISGFVRGCVYLLDGKGNFLTPKLKIGEGSGDRYRSISLRDSQPGVLTIVEALNSPTPIKEEGVFLRGEMISHVAGSFGTELRPGVLYLEISDELNQALDNEAIVYFRAIRHALNDCLALR